jgi:hypothetical protein
MYYRHRNSQAGGCLGLQLDGKAAVAAFGAGNLNPRCTTRFEPGEWFSPAMKGQGGHLVAG